MTTSEPAQELIAPDLCLWGPAITRAELAAAIEHARAETLHGISVFSGRAVEAQHLLEESDVKLIAAIGFPFGAMDADAKRYEIECALDAGAQEFDLFAPTGQIKDGNLKLVLREMRDAVEAAEERPVTVVVQPSLLDPSALLTLVDLALDAEAKGLALWRPVDLLPDLAKVRAHCGPKFHIKTFLRGSAAATIPDLRKAGASRFGFE